MTVHRLQLLEKQTVRPSPNRRAEHAAVVVVVCVVLGGLLATLALLTGAR